MINNTSAFQRMLLPFIATVTAQPIIVTEEQARKVLVLRKSDS